jgi:hypothetical protein
MVPSNAAFYMLISVSNAFHVGGVMPRFAYPAFAVVGITARFKGALSLVEKHVVRMILANYQTLVFLRAMVMNLFRRLQWAAKCFFGNKPMFVIVPGMSTGAHGYSITPDDAFAAIVGRVALPSSLMAGAEPQGVALCLAVPSAIVRNRREWRFLPASTMTKTVWNLRNVRGIFGFSHAVYSFSVDKLVRAGLMLAHLSGSFFYTTNLPVMQNKQVLRKEGI